MRAPPRIGIVDDDEAMREAFEGLMEVLDLDCLTFDSVDGFFASYAPGLFDCVVTDVRMPKTDGLEFQRRLKAVAPDLPVIFITAYADACTQRQALAGGAHAFLLKPVEQSVLHHCLLEALGQKIAP